MIRLANKRDENVIERFRRATAARRGIQFRLGSFFIRLLVCCLPSRSLAFPFARCAENKLWRQSKPRNSLRPAAEAGIGEAAGAANGLRT